MFLINVISDNYVLLYGYLEGDLLMFAVKLYDNVVRRKFCENMLKTNASCLNEWSQTVMLWVVLAITRASGLLKQLLVLINYIYGLSNRRIELLCTSSRSFLLEFLVCLSLKCGCVLVAFCLYMFLTKVPLMCLLLLWIMRILMELELQFRFLDWSVSPCIRAVNTTLCLSQS